MPTTATATPLRGTKCGSRRIGAQKLLKTQKVVPKNFFVAELSEITEPRLGCESVQGHVCTTLTATRQAPKSTALEATGLFFFDRHFRSFCAGQAI
jgi:hypothetical protein